LALWPPPHCGAFTPPVSIIFFLPPACRCPPPPFDSFFCCFSPPVGGPNTFGFSYQSPESPPTSCFLNFQGFSEAAGPMACPPDMTFLFVLFLAHLPNPAKALFFLRCEITRSNFHFHDQPICACLDINLNKIYLQLFSPSFTYLGPCSTGKRAVGFTMVGTTAGSGSARPVSFSNVFFFFGRFWCSRP